ncbi:MAG: DUF1697 domain-containing protein [Nitrospinota bacterium]|nr:DUF1697 domain-containing protein [Nitrospinota bacterium]
MNIWIALFRGINVGGASILPMRDLASICQKLGFTEVRTYIQSGNVVFHSPEGLAPHLTKRIGAAVMKSHGFKPNVILISLDELEKAASSNPFPEAEKDPKSLHFFFLAELPSNPDMERLEQVKSDSEAFVLRGQVFYLHAPDGIGRSKLAAKAEKLIGVAATARNWRTVRKVLQIAKRP